MARVADLSGNSPVGSLKEDRAALHNGADGYNDALTVTPSDTVNLAKNARALYIGGAGNVALVTREGTTQTFTAVPAGTLLKVSASRVNATNTTATLIKALY